MTRGTTQKDPTPPDGIMNWLIGPMGHSPGPLWRAGHLESNGAQPGKQLTPDSPLTTRPRRLSPPPPLRPAALARKDAPLVVGHVTVFLISLIGSEVVRGSDLTNGP